MSVIPATWEVEASPDKVSEALFHKQNSEQKGSGMAQMVQHLPHKVQSPATPTRQKLEPQIQCV
jgi:uncharacterized lipoprotein YmbA